jgi:asparagine synthase (glutamine-hydrolysing)
MCGIVGILSLDPRARVDEARLRRMRDVITHRGPDGEGLVLDGPVGLGHRRLAIVDVAGGHQPMANAAGDTWVSFNGEIYNHLALREGLESRGHRYHSRSDTETILHLYDAFGTDGLARLRGMFAIALWDKKRSRLVLARDPLGIKPLYYARTRDEVLFASEIKALLAAGLAPSFDEQVLPEYLATRHVGGETTFFQQVKALLPGHTLCIDAEGGATSRRRFWTVPPVAPDASGFSATAADVGEKLRAAVSSHLMSDVPLGLFLSGGIDSTALLGHMTSLLREPVRTFSVGFREAEASELGYARLAAEAAGARHREIVVSPEQFFEALPRLVWHEDEPIAFPSSVPLYFVSRLAAEDVKVVLTGEGSDELFLGYNRYRIARWNERLGPAYTTLCPSRLRTGIAEAIDRLPQRWRRHVERTFLALPAEDDASVLASADVFPAALQRQLLLEPSRLTRDPHGPALDAYRNAGGDVLDRLSRADIDTYLVRLLMKQDRMSMAASLESRVPFLDQSLVEYAAAIPSALKLGSWQTKRVLRHAVRDVVPKPILHRRKMGFPVPVGAWLRGPFWPLVEDLVLGPRAASRGLFDPAVVRRLAMEHHNGVANHGERLWLLANLEIWHRVFLEGERALPVNRAA